MAAAFPSSLIILGETGLNLTKTINDVSGGKINIKYYEPGALVPAMEIFDAVSTGSVDAGWASPAFWAGKVPALQFFTTFQQFLNFLTFYIFQELFIFFIFQHILLIFIHFFYSQL